MKTFSIHDKSMESYKAIGYLFYFERNKEFVIELNNNLNEWDAPLLFQKKVHDGEYTILNELASLWVRERIIPSGRQNISEILANSKLSEYSEYALLNITKGVCSMDECYLEDISYDDIPDSIKKRRTDNISDCFLTDSNCMVCLFNDNTVNKVSLKKLSSDFDGINYVLKHDVLRKNLRIDGGGYTISFDNNVVVPAKLLKSDKYSEQITAEDFLAFAKNGLTDTSGACNILECSRQNISYLVREGKLNPVINDSKEKIFTLGSVWLMD